jgi:hypothetical protein
MDKKYLKYKQKYINLIVGGASSESPGGASGEEDVKSKSTAVDEKVEIKNPTPTFSDLIFGLAFIDIPYDHPNPHHLFDHIRIENATFDFTNGYKIDVRKFKDVRTIPDSFEIEIHKNSVYVGRITLKLKNRTEDQIIREINIVMNIIHSDALNLYATEDGYSMYQSAADLTNPNPRKIKWT